LSRGFATAPPNADDPATESHKAAKTGIPNRQKTGLEPRFLAKTITSNPRLRRGDQPLRDSLRATIYYPQLPTLFLPGKET
jgi:hypothetical protein